MQNLMPPIDTTDHAFHDGDPTTGQLGTIVTAAWLNDVQGATRDIQAEIIAVLTKAGMQPNPQKQNQLAEAISQIIGSGGYATSGDLTLGLSKKIDKADIAQQLGNDTTKVPSLQLVTTELGKKASVADANSKLAKDKNGADIPDKEAFIGNLGLPELLDTKFDKTGGTIKAISDAINIQTEWSQSGYLQISGEDGRPIHQLGKLNSDNRLELRNVAESGTLAVSGDGARFNGRLLGFINGALNSGNGWWRDSSTGLLIQWGNTPAGSDTRQVNFPIPFKSWPHAVVHFDDGWYSGGGATWGAVDKSLTGFTGKTSVALEGGAFIAIGF
ncbi:hypothetical protein Q4R34_13565 [Morganella morganii]